MTEIFKNRGVESKEEAGMPKENKRGKELTPKERYVLNTPAGRILHILEKDPYIEKVKTSHRGTGAIGIDSLKNHGIIEIKGIKVVKIHYENIINLWRDTKGPKILELFNEERKELTVREISKLLNISFDKTNDEIHKMEISGLLKVRKIGNKTRVFHLAEHSEETMSRR